MYKLKIVPSLFFVSFVMLLLLFVSVPREVFAIAAVWTDKADYQPWETVTIYGSGFNPNVYYDIPVIRPDGSIVRGDGSSTLGWDTVQADAYGEFTYYYQLDGIEGLYEVRVYGSPWSGSLELTPLATTTFTEAPPKANLDQVRNGPATAPVSPGDWVNGNAGPSNAHYIEGYSIPYRCVMTNLPTGTPITLILGYDIKHGGKHAIDYLTHFNRINVPPHTNVFGHGPETIDPLIGVTVSTSTVTTFPIPAPSSDPMYPVPNQPTQSYSDLVASEGPNSVKMTLYGGTITGISYVSEGDLTAAKSETQISVSFTVDSSTAVLAWGGHIASRTDWGYDAGVPRSAGGISGSPYHMRQIDWSLDTIGQQDRSLKSAAVYVPGSITVIKDAIPDDPQDFSFTNNITSPFSFTLDDDDDGTLSNTEIFSNVPAGTYYVTEAVPTLGWDLTSIEIYESMTADSTSSGSTANIVLAAGESAIVIFNDTQRGKIIVEKQTDPDGSTEWFDFDPSWSTTFSLQDGDQEDSGWLVPGDYSVDEIVPTGWDLTSVTKNGAAFTDDTTFTLGAGETITLVYTNTQRGKIIVDKETIPAGDPQSFDFSLTGGPSSLNQLFSLTDLDPAHDSGWILPGSGYAAAETTVPTGWDLTSASCSDGSPINNIDISPGEIVIVTFTDTKRGGIVVRKITLGGVGTFDFVGAGTTMPPGLSSFSITTVTPGVVVSKAFSNVEPGTYTVTETVPGGWDLTDITIADPDGESNKLLPTATLDIDPGETVIVTFTDECALPEKASLGNFVWEDLNGNGVQDPSEPGVSGVTASLYWSDGTFVGSTTTDGSGYYSFTDLDPGDYYLVLTLPSGYVFTIQDKGADDAVDSDVDPSTGRTIVINLQAGENDPSWDVGLIKAPVGGIWIPIDKTELLAPWIGWASFVTASTIFVVYVNRKKKRRN